MTCREFVAFIEDYLGGALLPVQQTRFERHLEQCVACARYLASYRASSELARLVLLEDQLIPPDVPEDLVAAVLAARHPAPDR